MSNPNSKVNSRVNEPLDVGSPTVSGFTLNNL